jgi:cob(I)alamin adenosyltransferase
MKIYTKRGDAGETDLFGSGRVSKDTLRVETFGTVDECNAAIGLARAASPALDDLLGRVQNDLFALGAELASPGALDKVPLLGDSHVTRLEEEIDAAEAQLAPLRHFILPGGSAIGAGLHFARTVARRAERLAVTLSKHEALRPEVVRYLNRLSDHLFVHARLANHLAQMPETPWLGRG